MLKGKARKFCSCEGVGTRKKWSRVWYEGAEGAERTIKKHSKDIVNSVSVVSFSSGISVILILSVHYNIVNSFLPGIDKELANKMKIM